jgi:hypothetical protein
MRRNNLRARLRCLRKRNDRYLEKHVDLDDGRYREPDPTERFLKIGHTRSWLKTYLKQRETLRNQQSLVSFEEGPSLESRKHHHRPSQVGFEQLDKLITDTGAGGTASMYVY